MLRLYRLYRLHARCLRPHAESDPHQVIPVIMSGIKNALAAAARTSSIKGFVYTSSSAAAITPIVIKKLHVDVSSWNDTDIKAAWAPPPYNDDRRRAFYAASKTLAEKEWALSCRKRSLRSSSMSCYQTASTKTCRRSSQRQKVVGRGRCGKGMQSCSSI